MPYPQTISGLLGQDLKNSALVYSFSASGAPLSHYLSFARLAKQYFQPDYFIFVIVGNDFDESLERYQSSPYFFYFEQNPDGGLELTKKEERFSFMRRGRNLLARSALVNYLYRNLEIPNIINVIKRRGANSRLEYVGNTLANFDSERFLDSQRAVDTFLKLAPEYTGVSKNRILLVVDAPRPQIYNENDLDIAANSYFGKMRNYLLMKATEGSFRTLDLQPIFRQHYKAHGQRFEFSDDGRWNELGHQTAPMSVCNLERFIECD